MNWDDLKQLLQSSGEDNVNTALSSIPGASSLADVLKSAPELWNKVKDSAPVQGITKALAGEPISPGIPNPGNPVMDIAEGAIAGQGIPPVNASPTPPVSPPSIPTPPPSDNSTPESTNIGKTSPSMASILPSSVSSNDEVKRQAELTNEKKKHLLGTLPIAAAGIGDAISQTGKAFGGEGTTGSAEKVQEELSKGEEARKGQVETNIKNDPNSDVSKAYRQMVLTIAPELSKKPDFQRMSAQEIGDKLPLIDTVMKAKATEATRQLALAQNKETKGQNALAKVQTAYNSDPIVKNADSMNAALHKADSLLSANQPVPPDMVGLIMAPAITGVKRFNTQELNAFRGEKDVPGRIAQVMKEATTGKFTGNNATLYKDISQAMQRQNTEDLRSRGELHAKQLASQVGGDWKQHYQDLTTQPYEEPKKVTTSGKQNDPLGIL